MPQPQPYDVIITGGGYAGLALAAVLMQAFDGSARVAVLDPGFGRGFPSDPNSSAIARGPRQFLAALGVWDGLAESAGVVEGMRITDARLDDILRPVWLGLDGDAAPLAHIVPNDTLRAALLDAARASGADLIPAGYDGHRTSASGVSVLLDDGRRIDAPLLVAADGARSRVRETARIRVHGWRYDQSAIVLKVTLPRPHDNLAVQHFLPQGPLAFLPLPQNQAAVIWSMGTGESQKLMAASEAAFCAALEEAAGPEGRGLTVSGPRAARPLRLLLARSFIAEGVALAGDAAHVVHPLAGQGLNLGLGDVETLLDMVARRERFRGVADERVLSRYRRARAQPLLAMSVATDGLHRLFAMQAAPVAALRNLGMHAVDRLPAIKRFLIGGAAG